MTHADAQHRRQARCDAYHRHEESALPQLAFAARVIDVKGMGAHTPLSAPVVANHRPNAATEAAAADPSIADDDSDNDLTAGASERQEALYRLIINGTTLVRAERIANYVGPVYQ